MPLPTVAIIVNRDRVRGPPPAPRWWFAFGPVLQFLYTSFFFNNFLPANVGGDVIRGYGLARYTDRTADAAVSVVVDRIIGLMAYMSTAAVAAIVAVNLTGLVALERVDVGRVCGPGRAGGARSSLLLSRRSARPDHRGRSPGGCWRRWRRCGNAFSDAFNAYRFKYGALALAFGVALVGITFTSAVNWCLSPDSWAGRCRCRSSSSSTR